MLILVLLVLWFAWFVLSGVLSVLATLYFNNSPHQLKFPDYGGLLLAVMSGSWALGAVVGIFASAWTIKPATK